MEDYKLQLELVDQALLTVTSDVDRVSLQSLKENLLELIELTRQTSEFGESTIEEKVPTSDDDQTNNDCESTDQQLAEISTEEDRKTDLAKLKLQLESMIGQKCSAPHKHSWGSLSYHNAIICGIDSIAEVANETDPAVYLRILFTNPTHKEMLPCMYFLEGECKFDDANCHFSHGELVPLNELREYKEPEFEKLVRNCVVLAKMQDRIWYKGRVLLSNFEQKECHVRLEDNNHKQKEIKLSFEDLFPIFHDEDLSSESSSDVDTSTDSEDSSNLETAAPSGFIENQKLFTVSSSQPLGEWEKHTRGIGSKLMQKMGYVWGTGLGGNGQGIITPISGQVLPQGCSLDYCMQLRESVNGAERPFKMEEKLKRNKRKLEEHNARAYEREKQRVDVFSFLNNRIFQSDGKQNTAEASSKNDRLSLQNQTTKSLNVESVRIADDIRKKKREIFQMEESMRRNAVGTDVYKRLQTQLNSSRKDLENLNQAESSLTKEQATRKTKDKLCIF